MDKKIRRLNLLSNEFLHIRQLFNLLPQAFSKQENCVPLTKKLMQLNTRKGGVWDFVSIRREDKTKQTNQQKTNVWITEKQISDIIIRFSLKKLMVKYCPS